MLKMVIQEVTPGRDVKHPPPTSTEVKERAEIYFYFSSVT
jgi:hypothetical protein